MSTKQTDDPDGELGDIFLLDQPPSLIIFTEESSRDGYDGDVERVVGSVCSESTDATSVITSSIVSEPQHVRKTKRAGTDCKLVRFASCDEAEHGFEVLAEDFDTFQRRSYYESRKSRHLLKKKSKRQDGAVLPERHQVEAVRESLLAPTERCEVFELSSPCQVSELDANLLSQVSTWLRSPPAKELIETAETPSPAETLGRSANNPEQRQPGLLDGNEPRCESLAEREKPCDGRHLLSAGDEKGAMNEREDNIAALHREPMPLNRVVRNALMTEGGDDSAGPRSGSVTTDAPTSHVMSTCHSEATLPAKNGAPSRMGERPTPVRQESDEEIMIEARPSFEDRNLEELSQDTPISAGSLLSLRSLHTKLSRVSFRSLPAKVSPRSFLRFRRSKNRLPIPRAIVEEASQSSLSDFA